jgi:hypothetical protein
MKKLEIHKSINEQAVDEIVSVFKGLYEDLLQYGGQFIGAEEQYDGKIRDFSETQRFYNWEDENLFRISKITMEEGIEALRGNDIDNVSYCYEQLINVSDGLNVDVTRYQERFEEALLMFDVSDIETLFVAEKPSIYVPELIISTSELLLKKINRNPDYLFNTDFRASFNRHIDIRFSA